MDMTELFVSLAISSDEYIKHYQGVGCTVHTRAHTGESIRFPANILQSYITHHGIRGTFCIVFDEYKKFKSITRVD